MNRMFGFLVFFFLAAKDVLAVRKGAVIPAIAAVLRN
jgi:hypothetical protein